MTTNQTHKHYRVTQDSECNGHIVRDYRFRVVAKFAAFVYGGSAVTDGEPFRITFEEI
jgi:hypothetical protein